MGVIVQTSRALVDIERSRTEVPPAPAPAMRLFKITAAALIPGSDKRYIYSMTRAVIKKKNASLVDTYEPEDSDTNARYKGVSISELSNAVPTGFAAKAIPDGSYVVAFSMPMVDGGVVWIIVNTQAIDGTC